MIPRLETRRDTAEAAVTSRYARLPLPVRNEFKRQIEESFWAEMLSECLSIPDPPSATKNASIRAGAWTEPTSPFGAAPSGGDANL